MLNWCKDTKGRIKDGIAINCYNWVCRCGHIADKHLLYDKKEIIIYNINEEVICGQCKCRGFMFASNDNCTIECQMKYKLNEL